MFRSNQGDQQPGKRGKPGKVRKLQCKHSYRPLIQNHLKANVGNLWMASDRLNIAKFEKKSVNQNGHFF